MPSPNRPRIGVKLVPNLLPSHVVDIPVAEHHAVVGVRCSLNYATNLCFEIHKAVNLAIYLSCLEQIHAIDDYINELFGLTQEESEYIKGFALRYRVSGGALGSECD